MKRVRILIAEDNPADVWLIEEALKRQSMEYEIENYTTAEEAIIAVGKCGTDAKPLPDLMLVDYNLPTGHGGSILAAAAENPKLSHTPKAVVTSFLQPHELKLALDLGAQCVITKPANLEDFMTEVGGKIAEMARGRGDSTVESSSARSGAS